jgi:hypothetical protein
MNICDKLVSVSADLSRVWPCIHDTTRRSGDVDAKNLLFSLKRVNAYVEDLSREILQIEHSLTGGDMSDDRLEELETSVQAETMFRAWLPIMMGEHLA